MSEFGIIWGSKFSQCFAKVTSSPVEKIMAPVFPWTHLGLGLSWGPLESPDGLIGAFQGTMGAPIVSPSEPLWAPKSLLGALSRPPWGPRPGAWWIVHCTGFVGL